MDTALLSNEWCANTEYCDVLTRLTFKDDSTLNLLYGDGQRIHQDDNVYYKCLTGSKLLIIDRKGEDILSYRVEKGDFSLLNRSYGDNYRNRFEYRLIFDRSPFGPKPSNRISTMAGSCFISSRYSPCMFFANEKKTNDHDMVELRAFYSRKLSYFPLLDNDCYIQRYNCIAPYECP